MRNRYGLNDIFEMFEELFAEVEKDLNICSNAKYIVPGSYPPVNVIFGEDKNLVFELALAGKKIEDIDIEFSGNFMTIKLKKTEKKEVKYLHKGISDASVDMKLFVPAEKFNFSGTTAKMNNGLLTILIPSKTDAETSKTKVNIEKD